MTMAFIRVFGLPVDSPTTTTIGNGGTGSAVARRQANPPRLQVLGVLAAHGGPLIRCKEPFAAPLDLRFGGEKFSHAADPGCQTRVAEALEVKRECTEGVGVPGDVLFGIP